jgi:hypothetical protein
MYSQERELKKLRYMVRNKAKVEGCIAEAFTCKEIINFSTIYFSRANNMYAPTTRYHVVRDVLLSQQCIISMMQVTIFKYTILPISNNIA